MTKGFVVDYQYFSYSATKIVVYTAIAWTLLARFACPTESFRRESYKTNFE